MGAMGRVKGYGRGKKGRGGYVGMPGMMPMSLMTEDGLQYLPYDYSYDGGCFMPYQPMGSSDVFGMSAYGSSYPQGWWTGEGEFADPERTTNPMLSRSKHITIKLSECLQELQK